MKHEHTMPFGARHLAEGGARFRLWAPGAATVELLLGETALPMLALADGWFEARAAQAVTGDRYAFRIDGSLTVPDPASRCNPDDVHGASLLTDPQAFDWPDDGWQGRPWHEAVVYELHVGSFTPAGSFAGVIERLDDLVALGVTAIELMPVADFPGRRGWGYDGVLPYAPDAAYGSPDDFKRLVAAAHARGLMVLLDVVYNHFGPDGNYLHAYAPAFFNAEVHTPWGAAINLDGPRSRTVRDFFIHNALYWLTEFQLDGLRIDAVHAMHDSSPLHFIDELAMAVHQGPGKGRAVHLVLENDLNDARRLRRDAGAKVRRATAQWNDDLHHAAHVLATGEGDGYYADFADQPLEHFGRALAEGFAYQGQPSAYRGGAAHGTPSTALPPGAFVNALQNHDQVGNRALGERLQQLAAAAGREDTLRALLACVLLSPATPMLFMGEEFAASTPFLYFCDFQGDLARAVTEGRRNEFGRFARFADPALRSRIPDPNDPATLTASTLRWSERDQPDHAHWLALYTELLGLRHSRIVPWLRHAASGSHRIEDGGLLRIVWPLGGRRRLHLLARLADPADGAGAAVDLPPGETVYDSHPGAAADTRPPWSVRVSLQGLT